MNDRGRLDFSNLDSLADNEELLEMKKQWESFAANEEKDIDKYFRELEIQFSLNEMASGENKTVGEASAKVFSNKKLMETVSNLRSKMK
ncbi:MAG: hypothetical protein PUD72_08200 [Oscillospiraceae bacterium]|nr:hypothetical protein [Oscillospiraceae bacterium]